MRLLHAIVIQIIVNLMSNTDAAILRPDDFYGSEALLDGYCDDAQYFIDAFTLSSERLKVEGSANDVTRTLNATNRTGKNF